MGREVDEYKRKVATMTNNAKELGNRILDLKNKIKDLQLIADEVTTAQAQAKQLKQDLQKQKIANR